MMDPLWGLYSREVRRIYRNPFVLAITILQPFMWLGFYGLSFALAPPTFLSQFFGTSNYLAYLMPGVLSSSTLSTAVFGSMSTIQDKRFGFLKRILLTPVSKTTVFLSKALGSTTRGLIQFPVVAAAGIAFGVPLPSNPLVWLAWLLSLFLLGVGFTSVFLTVTASSTDRQTPGVVANFITLPLMFSSTALLPQTLSSPFIVSISMVNPITFSAKLGRAFVLGHAVPWLYFGYLFLFAGFFLIVGALVNQRWLRFE